MGVFSPSGSSGSGSVSLVGATSPLIANVPMAAANTEYSYALPATVKRFDIKLRGLAKLKLSYVLGDSGLVYITIPAGVNYCETELTATGIVLYFQSPLASQVAEIVSWV